MQNDRLALLLVQSELGLRYLSLVTSLPPLTCPSLGRRASVQGVGPFRFRGGAPTGNRRLAGCCIFLRQSAVTHSLLLVRAVHYLVSQFFFPVPSPRVSLLSCHAASSASPLSLSGTPSLEPPRSLRRVLQLGVLVRPPRRTEPASSIETEVVCVCSFHPPSYGPKTRHDRRSRFDRRAEVGRDPA